MKVIGVLLGGFALLLLGGSFSARLREQLKMLITVKQLFLRIDRELAVRRLLILAFAVFAVLTVLFPGMLTRVAHLVGVGRGADLLLYATVLVLLGFLALQEARTKAAEKRTTYLARRLALDEAEQPAAFRDRALPRHD